MSIPTIKLNDGGEIPVLAFGTGSWLRGKAATEYVDNALNFGFSHIDTAAIYYNEDSVGTAIRESGIDRKDLYITTKYDGGDIQEAIRASLEKLGLKSVDLYLIHFPGLVEKDFGGAWAEFVKIKESGLARSIGVSNFTLEQLQTVVNTGTSIPAVNQIQFHAYNYASHKDLLEFSAKHGIVTEAFGSLACVSRTTLFLLRSSLSPPDARSPITTYPGGAVDSVLATIAARIGGTPAQVIFKWVLAKGAVVVTSTSRADRLKEYLAVTELPDLTEAEVASIDTAGAQGPPSPALKKLSKVLAALIAVLTVQLVVLLLVKYVVYKDR
ncbi:Aldo/keto reductase [Auriscalpium vulgare]|uniref:Aldo/keto reductase n=1 Tax=Auriscalpium vulgare TaxID=40419 RepID=A0ACB8RE33_9AGAM|nr:Aldo/keto reductase [Auriscalpium vulgare]